MTCWEIQVMLMMLSVFISSGQGKRDQVLYCSACKAIVDELNYSISQVDPKKNINVGGFRINPDGTMKDKKVHSMTCWEIQVMLMMLSVFISSGQGKRDQVLYCSACKAIVDELNYSISQVDPKKNINVGGFRINPDGTMKDKKVPLARSQTHLAELLEGVCDSMSDYAVHVDPDTQIKDYRRFAPRSGGGADAVFPDFKNFQFDGPEASGALKFACESIVEDLEDDIMSLFSEESQDVRDELCSRVSDYCRRSTRSNEEL